MAVPSPQTDPKTTHHLVTSPASPPGKWRSTTLPRHSNPQRSSSLLTTPGIRSPLAGIRIVGGRSRCRSCPPARQAWRPRSAILPAMTQGSGSLPVRQQTITGRTAVTSSESVAKTSPVLVSLSWVELQAMLPVMILAIHGLTTQHRLEGETAQ